MITKGKTKKGRLNTMGMAASQATLLALTGRLHDIEYKAQNIQSQKIALATQKDELYQDYCDALDAKKIQIAFNNGDGSCRYVDASFATMCGYNEDRRVQYTLRDANTNKIIVDQRTADMFENYDTDKYAFAYAMLGMDCNFGWGDEYRATMGSEIGIGTAQDNYGDGMSSSGGYNLFMTDVERKVFEKYTSGDKLDSKGQKLKDLYDELVTTCNDSESSDTDKDIALQEFRDYLYKSYSNEIYNYMRLNKGDTSNTDPENQLSEFDDEYPEDFPKGEFEYYVHLFEQLEDAGGCQVVDTQYASGEEGNEWLNNMVKSGRVLIDFYNKDKKEWTETSVATSTNANYIQEVPDDTDLKKAEAEYEYELGVINRKDTKFDQDLNKLETERSAIKTQIESIEKVRDDNIERTYNIFS